MVDRKITGLEVAGSSPVTITFLCISVYPFIYAVYLDYYEDSCLDQKANHYQILTFQEKNTFHFKTIRIILIDSTFLSLK